jgi:FkbM family methyltransferase
LNKNLIFDVGMHKGEDTDFYLKKGFNVIGFEADPDLIKYCKERFKSEISNNSLIIVEGAIVNKNFKEDVVFYKNKKNTVWGTVLQDWADRNKADKAYSEIIRVKSVNFKECLKEYGIPYFMKIDIEGMDFFCCETLLEFNERPNFISIESNKTNFCKLSDEINLFKKLGYDKFKIIQQDGISKQKEISPSKEGNFLNYKFKEGSSGLFGEDLPGKWINSAEALKRYKIIFLYYKLFGDKSFLRKFILTKILLKIFRRVSGIPTPGWYDTHVKFN